MMQVPTISKVDVAFGADALKWMPAMDTIPAEYPNRAKFERLASEWFYRGLPGETDFIPKPELSEEQARMAMMVLKATLGSFAPKHEHKMAAVAFMMSEWFSDIVVPETMGTQDP